MRDFGWNVFRQTGNIEAYLFSKEVDRLKAAEDAGEEAPPEEGAETAEEDGQG